VHHGGGDRFREVTRPPPDAGRRDVADHHAVVDGDQPDVAVGVDQALELDAGPQRGAEIGRVRPRVRPHADAAVGVPLGEVRTEQRIGVRVGVRRPQRDHVLVGDVRIAAAERDGIDEVEVAIAPAGDQLVEHRARPHPDDA
jgi:hypothetical protein